MAAPPPDPAVEAVVPTPPAPTPTAKQHHPLMAGISIPVLKSPQGLLMFGRNDSDYHVQRRVLDIAGQHTMAERTYRQLVQLTSVDLPITEAEFVRMWRTLMLKRAQDIFEMETGQRADNYIRLSRVIPVPATLGDLLYSLGSFHSAANGVRYFLHPPARPAQVPDWWQIDPAIIENWMTTMGRFSRSFIMREFPAPTECRDKPMIVTAREQINDLCQVRALTNETQPSDGYVRFVNDELFVADDITFDRCHLNLTERTEITVVRSQYVYSYVSGSNV